MVKNGKTNDAPIFELSLNDLSPEERQEAEMYLAEMKRIRRKRESLPPWDEDEREELPRAIAVDFDGCLCVNRWPEIGEANLDLVCRLIDEQERGARVILWTCRTGERLTEAVNWCRTRGLEFDAVNANLPERVERFGFDSRKVSADEYWDDKAVTVRAGEHFPKAPETEGAHAGDRAENWQEEAAKERGTARRTFAAAHGYNYRRDAKGKQKRRAAKKRAVERILRRRG